MNTVKLFSKTGAMPDPCRFCDIPTSTPGSLICLWSCTWSLQLSDSSKFQLLLSSSEPQAPRKPPALRWSSRTGPPQLQPRSGWDHTWWRTRRLAARRSGLCKRSPSGTGRSNLQVWSLRLSLQGWWCCQLLTTGWGTDCGRGGQKVVTISAFSFLIKLQKWKVQKLYLELDVELVVWEIVPMPVELGIWRDQLSWVGKAPEVLSM